jgi:hypothetical protein
MRNEIKRCASISSDLEQEERNVIACCSKKIYMYMFNLRFALYQISLDSGMLSPNKPTIEPLHSNQAIR